MAQSSVALSEPKTESDRTEPTDKSNKAELTLAPNLSPVGTQSQQAVKAEVVIAGSIDKPDATELTLVPKLLSTDKAGSTYPKKRPKYQATGKGTFS